MIRFIYSLTNEIRTDLALYSVNGVNDNNISLRFLNKKLDS